MLILFVLLVLVIDVRISSICLILLNDFRPDAFAGLGLVATIVIVVTIVVVVVLLFNSCLPEDEVRHGILFWRLVEFSEF